MANWEDICSHEEQANYLAIRILEEIGLTIPTQKQIDIIESIVLFAIQPKLLTLETLKACIGNDNIAQRILLHHLQKHTEAVC